ncbi:MAG: SHOCT domain-containing protein [Anaerolineae bacterium]|nr:SHOCT domain-containing protein [Anaerolineae bacterium]
MARLGCLLLILGMVALCGLVVLPVLPFTADTQAIDAALQPLLCNSGETLRRDLYSSSYRPGETSFSMDVTCLDSDNRERDVTGQWMLLSAVAFTAPFLIGLTLFIVGVSRATRRSLVASTTDFNQVLKATGFNMPPAQTPVRTTNNPTLTQRLKELQEARDVGLITEQEFQQKRKELLDKMM